MTHPPSNFLANLLRSLPRKWAIVAIVALVVYGVAQPSLNHRFGLNLPSYGTLAGNRESTSNENESSARSDARTGHADSRSRTASPQSASPSGPPAPGESSHASATEPPQSQPSARPAPTQATSKGSAATQSHSNDTPASSSTAAKTGQKDFLESVGNQVFRSPAGLIYRRGSAEGHRLKHLERHIADQPGRPGPHGVFEGDMQAFLKAIDDAYLRAKRRDKGTKQYTEEDRTVYEANFGSPIGYLGGQEGRRKRNPKLNRLRIVIDDQAVITAFPF